MGCRNRQKLFTISDARELDSASSSCRPHASGEALHPSTCMLRCQWPRWPDPLPLAGKVAWAVIFACGIDAIALRVMTAGIAIKVHG